MGKFELANGGTIFLDEIGEIDSACQVKLLRVLQDGKVQRIGSNREIQLDVRIIAATNKDLNKEMLAGRFRDDLFYRLNVYPLEMPSLRSRKEDIPLLVDHFLRLYSCNMGKPVREISSEALQIMMDYDWPGNVRELEGVIRRAIVLTDGKIILPSGIPGLCLTERAEDLPVGLTKRKLKDIMAYVEKAYLMQLLAETNWDKIEAVRRSGIHRTNLDRKIKKYQLKPPGC